VLADAMDGSSIMKITAFAPHLAGRMLPPILSALMPHPARFKGDPRAEQAPTSSFYWMHAAGCENGLYRAMRNEEFWQRVEEADPTQPRRPDTSEFPMWFAPACVAPASPADLGSTCSDSEQLDLFNKGD
jgi:hypothetical protein